jgi:hypothetical protein
VLQLAGLAMPVGLDNDYVTPEYQIVNANLKVLTGWNRQRILPISRNLKFFRFT